MTEATATDCQPWTRSTGRPIDWTREPSPVLRGLAGKTRLVLVGLVALHIGCGGGTDGSPIPPPTTPEPTPPAPPPPPPEDLVVPPAEAGKIAPDRIAVTLASAAGEPLADTAYEWTTDEHSGWVFPAEGRSDSQGKVDGAWIPGFPGLGRLTLRYAEAEEEKVIEFETFSETPENPPWAQVFVRLWTPLATGYSIDVTPLTDPIRTYYSPLNWDSAYAGLQRRGTHFERQLQFSVWDADEGESSVAEATDGLDCARFGHEGTGVQCRAEYPWVVGGTYRFQMTEEIEEGVSEFALEVTDLGSGVSRYIGKLRFGRKSRLDNMVFFVEDFDRTAPNCLDQAVMSAAFRRAMARTADGRWVPIVDGLIELWDEDRLNPGTPPCANFDVLRHPSGLEVRVGGLNVRDPHATIRVTIPE